MKFLFPTFLWALSLTLIPVIIHLFNFQRAKKVYFTNVDLLKTVKQTAKSRNQLKHWLVLLSRIAFVIFLVLAFAQPFLPVGNANSKAISNLVSVYLDNSYSMQNEADGKRLFDLAKSYADQIGNLFPVGTQFHLTDNRPEESGAMLSIEQLQNKISKMEMSAVSKPIEAIYLKQNQVLEQVSGRSGNHIFILSDFQKSTIGNIQALASDTANRIYLLPFVNNQTPNLSIDSVWLKEPFIVPKEVQTIYFQVKNHGDKAVENINIRLIVNNKQEASSIIENLPAGSATTGEFVFITRDSMQTATCRITLDDFPISFDNDYHFVLRVAPTIKIVEVCSIDNKSPHYIENVFEGESFFAFARIKVEAPDYSLLTGADLIILNNIRDIEQGILNAVLKAYLSGATVVIFPHEKANTLTYNNLVSGVTLQLRELPSGAKPQEYFISLDAPDISNPFFNGVFEKIPQNLNLPLALPTLSWGNVGQTILKFKNNIPFLTMLPRSLGGRIFLFASPLQPDLNSFGTHALFLPVMYRIAFTSKLQSEELAYRFGDGIAVLQIDSLRKNDVLHLTNDQTNYITNQRISENRALLTLPSSGLAAGTYTVRTERLTQPIGVIAINYPRDESAIKGYTPDELKEIFKNLAHVRVFEPNDLQSFKADFKTQTEATPLWRLMLLLALLALLAEILLLRFWKTNVQKNA